PLFPLPQKIQIGREERWGTRATSDRKRPRPARSINVRPGTPEAMVRRSISCICDRVTTFIGSPSRSCASPLWSVELLDDSEQLVDIVDLEVGARLDRSEGVSVAREDGADADRLRSDHVA